MKHKLAELLVKIKLKLSEKRTFKFLVLFGVLLLFGILYHLWLWNRVIPGVRIGNIKVGGLTFSQAKSALEQNESNLDKKFALKYDQKSYLLKYEDIDLKYDWDASVSRAFEVGRTGNFLVDTKDKIAGIVKPIFIAAYTNYNDQKLSNFIATIKGEINQEAVDASIKLDGQKIEVTKSSPGLKIVDESIFKIITNSFDRVEFENREIPTKVLMPKIVESDVSPHVPEVQKIISRKIQIVSDKKTWDLTTEQLAGFVEFSKEDEKTKIVLDEPDFDAFLETLAHEVNVLPRGKVNKTDGNKVVDFEITKSGSELDTKKTRTAFEKVFFGTENKVSLVMKEIPTTLTKEKYGIYALLGEGKSKYAGSSNARIHNLTLAAEKTNGVLVPPGVIYSLSSAIGPIDGANGFDAALIIKGGRTVLGEGGGVCQTSTTLFRAVLNSGLPVVMRYPHAYRVYYYEQDSKPGIDASIYQPTLDFQFKNDTSSYVLIQTEYDIPNVSLTFKIFGTPDGRSVELSEPVITSQTPPAEALYVDDPNLKEGQIVQTEHAAWGASVYFTRVVKRGTDILYSDTFSTRYQPWRAVFLRGTKKS